MTASVINAALSEAEAFPKVYRKRVMLQRSERCLTPTHLQQNIKITNAKSGIRWPWFDCQPVVVHRELYFKPGASLETLDQLLF